HDYARQSGQSGGDRWRSVREEDEDSGNLGRRSPLRARPRAQNGRPRHLGRRVRGADGRFAKTNGQPKGSTKSLQGTIRRDADGADKKDEVKLSKVSLRESQLHLTFEGKAFSHEGVARLSAVVAFPPEGKKTWLGSLLWADGVQETVKSE